MSRDLRDDADYIVTNIRRIIEKGKYVGWSATEPNTHKGTAFFVYFSKDLRKKVYVGLKYLEKQKVYKPYAIYSETEFNKERGGKIEKKAPTI